MVPWWRRALVLPILGYKRFISPMLPPACRYEPTCSVYMMDAILKHGLCGLGLGVRRLLRCHPWGQSGYDPVPAICGCGHHDEQGDG